MGASIKTIRCITIVYDIMYFVDIEQLLACLRTMCSYCDVEFAWGCAVDCSAVAGLIVVNLICLVHNYK